jgi:carotenoid cleavage dioxygenase-like enzyme
VAFRSRLRRVDLDLAGGAVRVATHLHQYLEMPAINEQRWGQPHRYVYGYNSVFDEGNVQIGIAKAGWKPLHHRNMQRCA